MLHPQVLYFHSQCLSLCGDIQLMLAQNANNRAAYLEEYSYQTKEDQEILHSLHRESSCQGGYPGRDDHRDLKAHNKFLFLLIRPCFYSLPSSLQHGNRPGHGPRVPAVC